MDGELSHSLRTRKTHKSSSVDFQTIRKFSIRKRKFEAHCPVDRALSRMRTGPSDCKALTNPIAVKNQAYVVLAGNVHIPGGSGLIGQWETRRRNACVSF